MYENVPDELKELNQWCVFRLQQRNGRTTKVPFNAETGEFAKSNDPTTWSSYDTALRAVSELQADGLGFFFKEPYFGIDIDGVENDIRRYEAQDDNDTDHNIVAEFIDIMESYAEISPSGKGIHIIAKGELPKNGSRKGNVEMYATGRFFTITGNIIGGYHSITHDDMGKINYLHEKYIKKSETKKPKRLLETYGNDLSEQEIINAALNSKNGMRFKLFLEGGWEQFYDSQSEADMAFANDLAFWTNRDFNMMDDIFRDSSLSRDKWDRKTGDSTYGELTLSKAINECTNVFTPRKQKDDFNIYLMDEEVKQIERKAYSYDDTGNAQRFVDLWGDYARFSFVRKNWYFYNGKFWELDQSGEMRRLVDETLEHMKKEPIITSEDVDEEDAEKFKRKHLKYSRGSNGKNNMLKESQHLRAISPNEFDEDKHLFNVANGFIDLRTSKLHEHDPDRHFTKYSPVEFTDKIDCPMWIDFLNQIFDNDQELIDYLQRAIGYSLSGSTVEQMMFILYGNGRNGKSVFLDVIKEIFGSYTLNIQPQTLMVKSMSGGANSDIARLQGARLVTTTEPNDGMRFDEGLVKQITGGDEITARFLYGDEFDFKPELKLWMATNHKPIIRGTDDGIWRRMAIVPFKVQIPEYAVDKQLTQKLKRELKAILNWAVDGYRLWKDIGLAEPQTVAEQRNSYRKEMDPVEAFIEECCVRDVDEREKSSDLYQAYKNWATANGEYVMSHTKFGKEMSNKFKKILSAGTYYKGVKLLESERTFSISY